MLGARPDLDARDRGPDQRAEDDYTIVIVTHNMQQAARVTDRTAFFNLEATGKPGRLIEIDDTTRRSSATRRRRPPRTTSPAASADRYAAHLAPPCPEGP